MKFHFKEIKMKYKEVNSIKREGFPTSSKEYKEAHSEADKAEKKKYPKGYNKLKDIDSKLPKKELVGKSDKKGKVTVSKKVPKKLRNEVAYHEKYENKTIKRLKEK